MPGISSSDNRLFFTSATVQAAKFAQVIYLTNTTQGYTYSLTAQLAKSFPFGLDLMGAYTYGESKDVNSGASSVAYSQWRYNTTDYNPNNAELGYSNYDIRHHFIASVTYKINYFDRGATSITLFGNLYSGNPFSFVYNGDLNGDGQTGNDLIYIPKYHSDINLVPLTTGGVTYTTGQQWTMLDNYISNDSYLKNHRGQYMVRNAATTPWENSVDGRLTQDFYYNYNNKKHTLQFTFDVFNLGNLLNSSWGRDFSVSNGTYSLLNVASKQTATSPATFTFSPVTAAQAPFNVVDFTSRWRMQIGIRYMFD